MGNGTSTPSRPNNDPLPANRLVNSGIHALPEKVLRQLAGTVLYTHAHQTAARKAGTATGESHVPPPVIRSLEELLSLLETDAVDVIAFDDSIPEHERRYIIGWARIFKPGVVCESRTVLERKLAGSVA